jgi:hypothetical protein
MKFEFPKSTLKTTISQQIDKKKLIKFRSDLTVSFVGKEKQNPQNKF